MVLYLFRDERFGGTRFFKPRMPGHEIKALLDDLQRREQAGEAAPPDVPPTFDKVLTIAPRYNRAIFYCGEVFHSGHIDAPELMVHAFFRLRMAAG